MGYLDKLIELKDIAKEYRMGGSVVRALKGVSLDVARGASIAVMGPSGSGKSTLMHIIGCLERPSSGAYFLDGARVDEMGEDALAGVRNRKIGFVFQTFNLLARHTARENVELPLMYAGMKETSAAAKAALDEVGLSHRMNHRPAELSGGERQRVAIARAVVANPSIILADEPTGNLDSRTGKEILDIFGALNRKGVTLVMVTHDRDVASHSERVITIRDGLIEGA
jgi:putative ABC transport system ATP-binding protein